MLPIANLLHNKLRTLLCASAVGIGIAMLVVQLSLSHGMLNEVAERMESVDAELIVLPKDANVIFQGGAIFAHGYIEKAYAARMDDKPVVGRVIPAFFETVKMAGQQQRLFGIDPEDMQAFFGSRKLKEGALFSGGLEFKDYLEELQGDAKRYNPDDVEEKELANGCELVIDSRLARVGDYNVGQTITIFGRDFRIVGIVEAGVAGRVFAPIQTIRHILNGGIPWSSMFFVKVADGVDVEAAANHLAEELHVKVELKSDYGHLLKDAFAGVNTYMCIASGVALAVCFLFIMLTMYTLILERTREIGILKSLGAGRLYIMRIILTESILVCCTGTAIGIGLTYLCQYAIQRFKPLFTIDIQPKWLLLGIAVGLIGGTLSAIYPGLRAARLDPATALSFE